MKPTARIATIAAIGAATLSGAFLSGCSVFGRTALDREDTTYDSRTVSGQLDFIHSLPGRSAITNDEAFHGIILFAEGVDPSNSYQERLDLLKSRGWLPDHFDEPGNLLVQRGRLASVFARVIEVPGGAMYNFTNGAPRYANRELIYLGIMQQASAQQIVSGIDFLSIIGRAEDYVIARAVRDFANRQPDAVVSPDVPGDDRRTPDSQTDSEPSEEPEEVPINPI